MRWRRRGVTAARGVIDATTDAQIKEQWSLLRGGKAMFNDVPLPAIYGATADEA